MIENPKTGVQIADDLTDEPIADLAAVIERDWSKAKSGVYFGAVPYLGAMRSLDSIDDMYGADDGHSIVVYFLSNANSWRGPVAKAVKAELKRRCKYSR